MAETNAQAKAAEKLEHEARRARRRAKKLDKLAQKSSPDSDAPTAGDGLSTVPDHLAMSPCMPLV